MGCAGFANRIASKIEWIEQFKTSNNVFDYQKHENHRERKQMRKNGYIFRAINELLMVDLFPNLAIKADVLQLCEYKLTEFEHVYNTWDICEIYKILAIKMASNYVEKSRLKM
jgi:hypothetical protein